MAERSIFDLDPDQLDRLLSIGNDTIEKQNAKGQEAPPDQAHIKPGGEPDLSDPERSGNSKVSYATVVEQPGGWIGRYKLLSVLGEGGMGMVYLAEQERPIKRRVALKIIKPGMDSKRVIARFEAERQTLALLDHPNIAHVYDAGTTQTGRPYFVMEYVEGLPVTEYCDHHKLSVEDRLTLFRQVCDAVQHAHQKGIIHRDIKPSNILVSTLDNQAVPKIIDFGVAKAISQPLTERTLATEDSQLLGTPEYMSPEQADLNNQDIDTRTDIYSLGVVLYRLLTGIPPFDPQTLQAAGIEHMRKVICEEEPKTPSTRLSKTSVEESTEFARLRSTNIRALQRRLHGDLDWIVMKSLEKDRTRRYGSASEFAADIQRHLDDEAVLAGPPSNLYRIKKFTQRNRTLVTGAVVVTAVLVAGVVVSTVFAIGQARARADAQEVADFLVNSTLGSFNTWRAKGSKVTVRSVLDVVAQNLEGKLTDQPLVQARIHQELVSCYAFLGFYDEAEHHQKRSLEMHRDHLSSENVRTLHAMFGLAWVYMLQFSHHDESERLATEALTGFERLLPEEDLRRLVCMETLGWAYIMQNRFLEGEQVFQRALRTIREKLGEKYEFTPSLITRLACAHQIQGHHEEAEALYVRGREISREVRGEDDLSTLSLTRCYGELCWHQGCYGKAEQLLVKALEGECHLLGEPHPETLFTMAALGWLYHSQGLLRKAEHQLCNALEAARAGIGEKHWCSLRLMHGLGTLYMTQERYDEAKLLLENALEIGIDLLGEENWYTLKIMNTFAKLYASQGHYTSAEKTFRQVLEARKRIWDANHPDILETINDFGVLRIEQKDYEGAEELLRQALDGRKLKLGNDHPACFESMHELAVLYKEQARYDDAEKSLLEALEGRRLKLSDEHPHTLESWHNLIELYEAWGKPEKAEEWRSKLVQRDDAGERD